MGQCSGKRFIRDDELAPLKDNLKNMIYIHSRGVIRICDVATNDSGLSGMYFIKLSEF